MDRAARRYNYLIALYHFKCLFNIIINNYLNYVDVLTVYVTLIKNFLFLR